MIKGGHSWFVLLSFLQDLCSLVNKLAVIDDILDVGVFPHNRYEVVTSDELLFPLTMTFEFLRFSFPSSLFNS